MRGLLLWVIPLLLPFISIAQSASYNFAGDTTVQLNVNGLLDSWNSTGREVDYNFNLYKYYTTGFEPLKSVTLKNNGLQTVSNISILFNSRRGWQNLNSMAAGIFNPTDPDKTKALKLWKFVYDNHCYFYSPETFNSPEIQDPMKFMSSYGYGDCFMIANLVKYLNTTYNGDSLWIWGLAGGAHAVTEYKINGSYAVLDADEGGFYLKLDNQTLASYDDIRYDPYLYLRTQHFGPANPYSASLNYYNVENYLGSNNYRSLFPEYGNSGISTAFSLRPGEQFSYVWTDTSVLAPFHQLVYPNYGQDPTLNDVGQVIKVGVFTYDPAFLQANANNLMYLYQNITIDPAYGDTVPVVHATQNSGANFVMWMTSPFVLTGGKIKGYFYAKTPADSISMDYSPDMVNWTRIWQGKGLGHYADSVSLDAVINPLHLTATYGYYLRCNFQPSSSLAGSGLDSIQITDSCQVSKFFMPHLQVGNNSISVNDSSASPGQLQLSLNWLENSSNTPPNAVASPIFPSSGGTVNGTSFTFSWQPATDNDGDAIVDYHFELSDDSAMSYPLATNFDRYMSGIGTPVTAQFTPERTDFLNAGKTYYWRVRALDSRGAWSAWSTIWKFIPQGPGSPINFHYESVDSSHVILRWSPNPVGNASVSYQIRVDTPRGFFPTAGDIVGTTVDTFLNLNTSGMEYVRISATDAFNNTSPSSPYITIWPPVTITYGVTPLSGLLPATSNNGYMLKYQGQDTSFLEVISGTSMMARKTGLTYLNAHFMNSIDSVIATEEVPVVIKKAPLLIGAANAYKLYGDTVPPLQYTFSGFVNGDDSAAINVLPVLASPVNQLTPVGSYAITVAGGLDDNYDLSYSNGVYTVDSAVLAIQAGSDTMTFGNPFPALSYTVSGWKNNDGTSSFLTLPQITTDATANSPAGGYDIVASGASARNYSMNYEDGELLINPTVPKLTFVVHGNYPDSSYTYNLTIDSSGGTFDNAVILVSDLGEPGANLNMNLLTLDTQMVALSLSDLPDNDVFNGPLAGIIPGHNYLAKAVVSNQVGADTSQNFYIFTDVNAPFIIYPNPAVSTMTFSLGIASEGRVQIVMYNSGGKEVYRNDNITGSGIQIDVSGMAPGTYIVTMVGKRRTYVKKVVIIH